MMAMDERTSPRAVLTDDETTSKIPRKLPIVLLAVFVVTTLALLGTTIYFAIQANNLVCKLQTAQTTQATNTGKQFGIYTRPTAQTTQATNTGSSGTPCVTDQCNKSTSVILNTMDKSQDPCHNFFDYACGGWNRRQVIPDDNVEVTKFSELDDDLKKKLKGLIEQDPQPNEPASYTKVRDYYQACADIGTVNSLGAQPLTDMLESLGGWPVLGTNPGGNWNPFLFSFESLWAKLRADFNIDAFVSASVRVNISNSREYILQVDIPEFAGPVSFREKRQKDMSSLIPEKFSRDFGRNLLLLDDLEEKRTAYLQYMIDIAVALGVNRLDATTDMTNVLEFEKKLARYAIDAIEDLDDLPEVMTIGDLQVRYYGVDWKNLFTLLMPPSVIPPVTQSDSVWAFSPAYLGSVARRWLSFQEDRVVANYMIWQLVNKMVPFLGQEYLTIHQNYIQALTDISAPAARWKDCVDQVNTVLPYATGRMYVDEYFSTDAKTKTEQMVGYLREALRSMINDVTWMHSSDKPKARQKLDAMRVAVGYPDWLKTDSTLDAKSAYLLVANNAHFTNALKYRRHVAQSELGSLRLPVDKSLWLNGGPAVINAYYSLSDNGIIIPAAILQPPFYHPDLPWFSNYGGIGVVLGHEVTHGFDSTGRLLDKDGNFRNWWSFSSAFGFDNAAQCMVDQYSAFVVPENGENVDGDLTEAENIADNGGLREAFKAYQSHAPSSKQYLPGLQDLTNDQMFFLSYSQVWCSVMNREGADLAVEYGRHSPGRFRVIGPLQNNEDFNKAFHCPTSSYMNRSHKCKVWY